MSRTLAVAAVLVVLAAAPDASAAGETRAEEVASLLAGTFEAGAARLVAARVPKSRLGDGAPVLYVEEAPVAAPDRPARLRFFRVEETADGGVVLRVLMPKETLSVRGKWREPSALALFARQDVVERIGCAIRLKRSESGWSGGTEGTGCPSGAAGARYARTELTLSPGRIEWRERGFDAFDLQVWGPLAGPTVWERRSASPPADGGK